MGTAHPNFIFAGGSKTVNPWMFYPSKVFCYTVAQSHKFKVSILFLILLEHYDVMHTNCGVQPWIKSKSEGGLPLYKAILQMLPHKIWSSWRGFFKHSSRDNLPSFATSWVGWKGWQIVPWAVFKNPNDEQRRNKGMAEFNGQQEAIRKCIIFKEIETKQHSTQSAQL